MEDREHPRLRLRRLEHENLLLRQLLGLVEDDIRKLTDDCERIAG